MSSLIYRNPSAPSNVVNLAAARADIAAIHSEDVIIEESLTLVGGTLSLPNGSITHDMLATGCVTLASAGGTNSLVVDGSGPDMSIRGLAAGPNITLSNATPGQITITATGGGGGANLAGTGTGATLVNQGVGPNLVTKDLKAGNQITLGITPTDITINGANVNISSAGGTASLVASGTGPSMSLKGLVAGSNVTLDTSIANQITINSTGGGGSTTLSGTGAGLTLVNDGVGPALVTKDLIAGNQITLTPAADSITIAGPNITLASAGGTNSLVSDGTGPDMTIRGLVAGSNVSLDSTVAGQITINASGGATTLSGTGSGETLVNDGVGPALVTKDLIAGAQVTFDVTANDITINSTGGTISSAGGSSLVKNGTGPSFSLRGLSATTGVSLTPDGGNNFYNIGTNLVAGSGITLTPAVLPDTSLTITAAGATVTLDPAVAPSPGDASLVADGVGPALTVRNLKPGTGVTLTQNANDVTITASAGGATLSNAAGATGTGNLIDTATPGPTDFKLRKILQGAGITVSTVGSDVQITNSAAGQVYTLADDSTGTVGPGTASIVAAPSPTANDFRVRRIVQGTGITIAQSGGDVVVTNSAAPGAVSLVSEAGAGLTTIVTDGVGPDLVVKATTSLGACEDRSSATAIRFDNRCIRISDVSGNTPPVADGANNNGALAATVIGQSATAAAGAANSVAIGRDAQANQARVTLVGFSASSGGADATAIGNNTIANQAAFAGGYNAQAIATSAIAIGNSASASVSNAIAIGTSTASSGNNSISVGNNASVTFTDGIAIGTNARTTQSGAIAIVRSDDGSVSTNNIANSYVIGRQLSGAFQKYAAGNASYHFSTRPVFRVQDTTADGIAGASISVAQFVARIFVVSSTNTLTYNWILPETATVWSTLLAAGPVNELDGGEWHFINKSTAAQTLRTVNSSSDWTIFNSGTLTSLILLTIPAKTTAHFVWSLRAANTITMYQMGNTALP